MSNEPASEDREQPAPPVTPEVELAPRWHTAALIAFLVLGDALTALLSRGHGASAPLPTASRALVYAPLLLVNWGMVGYVSRIGRARSALAPLIGRGLGSVRRACIQVTLGAVVFLSIEAFELVVARLAPHPKSPLLDALAPRSFADVAAWIVVAASIGFCEEVVYRGYLQRQLGAFTQRAWLGVVLQALLFGVAHNDQGLGVIARFTLYGIGLGALARWRKSLVPGMIGHIAIDVTSGLVAR